MLYAQTKTDALPVLPPVKLFTISSQVFLVFSLVVSNTKPIIAVLASTLWSFQCPTSAIFYSLAPFGGRCSNIYCLDLKVSLIDRLTY